MIIVYTFLDTNNNYEKMIEQWRSESEHYLTKASNPTVIRAEDSIQLHFYDIDPTLQIMADLTINKIYETIEITESNGNKTVFVKYGDLDFMIDTMPQHLEIYQDQKNYTKFLLPFKDSTNGVDTYGAGRMLPVKISGSTTKIELDFNRAFNPYCAYNPDYVCPITPPTNKLTCKIEAGEKLPSSNKE
jgi:uncharacterized protein (DUF1684 family)